MKRVDVAPFVAALDVPIPPVDRFWALGDVTALRQARDGRLYRANYERGILLYALVVRHRPTAVLEFGTGRGYGALCMAWAMVDHAIDGRIYTIDQVPHREPAPWLADWGQGPTTARLARHDVWTRVAPPSWTSRIEVLTGLSGEVMRHYDGAAVDLAFIDGGHDYAAVRHDFYSVLEVSADRFGVLLDDYAPTAGFGVERFVDDTIVPCFDATLVHSDRRWPGGERAGEDDPGYGMIWVHSDGATQPVSWFRSRAAVAGALRPYRARSVWAARALRVKQALKSVAGK